MEVHHGRSAVPRLTNHRSSILTNFLDLPNELLCTICDFVDLAGLKKFMFSCRRLNDVALPIYLARYGVHQPEIGMSLGPEAIHILSLLVLARPFPSTQSLSCHFGNLYFVRDIRALHSFVSRSPLIRAFTLDFRTVYGVASSLVGNQGQQWLVQTLLDILAKVLALGCESLTILQGFNVSHTLHAGDPTMKSGGLWLWSGLRRHFDGHHADTACSCPVSKLKSLKIHSTMMLLPPFIDHTMQILRCKHITDLSLDSTQLPSENWTNILPYITLPNLQKFSISILLYNLDSLATQKLAIQTILAFAARHPSVKDFSCFDFCDPTGIKRPQALLPLLESLDTHPEYITYFLQASNAFPNLRRVTISLPLIYNNFFSLNNALAVIGQRSADLTLCIKLPTFHHRLLSWLNVGLGHSPARRVECSLHCVKTLELHANTVSRPFIISTKPILPAWISLFPELRYLEIYEYSLQFMTRAAKTSFVQLLSSYCPKLETVKLQLEGHDVRTWLEMQVDD